MDEKFIRRFESFRNSLDSLAEAKQRDLSDSFLYLVEPVLNSVLHLTWRGRL